MRKTSLQFSVGALLGALFLGALTGCVTNSPKSSFDAVRSAYTSGNYVKAAKDGTTHLEQYQGGDYTAEILYYIADSYRELKEYQLAKEKFENLLQDYPASRFSITAKYSLGRCYMGLADYEEAVKILSTLTPDGLLFPGDKEVIKEGRDLLAEAYKDAGRYADAAREYANHIPEAASDEEKFALLNTVGTLYLQADDHASAYPFFVQATQMTRFIAQMGPTYLNLAKSSAKLKKIVEAALYFGKVVDDRTFKDLNEEGITELRKWLDTLDEEKQFQTALSAAAGGRTGYNIHWYYAHLLEDFEIYDRALQEADAIQTLFQNFDVYEPERVKEFRERIALKKAVDMETLACMMPLTGRFAAIGNRVVRGAKLALDEYNAKGPKKLLKLVVRDTQGTPEGAKKAFEEILGDTHAAAILGPLTSAEVLAVAPLLKGNQIAAISPSPAVDTGEANPFLFFNSLTYESQVVAVVDFSVNVNGFTHFAVLAPSNESGKELARLFEERVKERGGDIVASLEYKPGTVNFKEEIMELGKSRFQALFLPDQAKAVATLIPQLAFYDLTQPALLGYSGWNDPSLIEIAEKFVQGSVFTDGFFAGSPNALSREFVLRYKDLYGKEPELFAAQAYDAIRAFLACLERKETDSRFDIRDCLARLQNVPGVCGTFSFGLGNQPVKDVFLIGVSPKGFIQLN